MTASLQETLTSAAEDKKAEGIELIDIKGLSDVCDQIFICSGQNPKHTQAISTHIKEQIQKYQDIKPSYYEGFEEGKWILLDYGSVVVNVFLDEVRKHYSIEEMWQKRRSDNTPQSDT